MQAQEVILLSGFQWITVEFPLPGVEKKLPFVRLLSCFQALGPSKFFRSLNTLYSLTRTSVGMARRLPLG